MELLLGSGLADVDLNTVRKCIGNKTIAVGAVLHLGHLRIGDGKASIEPHHGVKINPRDRHLPFWVLAKMRLGIVVIARHWPPSLCGQREKGHHVAA
jgi:hypothetical protein